VSQASASVSPCPAQSVPLWRTVVRHPLAWCFALVIFGEVVKENYPFSNFPMYGEQKSTTDYYYLTDAAGQPLPTAEVTKLTSTKFKKMIDKELKPHGKGEDISLLPLEVHQQAARAVLERVHRMKGGFFSPDGRRRKPIGQPVTLHWVHVALQNDGSIRRTHHEVARF